MSTAGRPFYCMPWRDLHFFGPTETLYEGDPDDVFADEADIAFLLRETNHLFPRLGLARADIVSTWAGIRPLTHDPAMPMGHRSRRIYELAEEGLPGGFALTNGSLGAHRQTAQDLLAKLKAWFADPASGRGVARTDDTTAPSATSVAPRQGVSPSSAAPKQGVAPSSAVPKQSVAPSSAPEHAVTLEDMMARRLGLVWDADGGVEAAPAVARDMGAQLGWDTARVDAEVAEYTRMVRHQYGVREGRDAP